MKTIAAISQAPDIRPEEKAAYSAAFLLSGFASSAILTSAGAADSS
ncbi:hypothetical protein WP1_012 [Pseudomonas phage WP1]